jgi:hypothetical protein
MYYHWREDAQWVVEAGDGGVQDREPGFSILYLHLDKSVARAGVRDDSLRVGR